jgi:hypothetical protein
MGRARTVSSENCEGKCVAQEELENSAYNLERATDEVKDATVFASQL